MKTQSHIRLDSPITINRPMVIIPIEQYIELLRETDNLPTPILDKEIRQARARFRKRQFTKWEKLKSELL